METKHTPGPWNFHGNTLVQDKGNRLNLGTFHEAPGLGNAAAANARLISAAPDLLAALQDLLQGIVRQEVKEEHLKHYPEFARARAAIARAAGNQ